jgi:hypothetical protein
MPAPQTIPNLTHVGNVVPDGYSYYEKMVTPGDDFALPNAYLKCYNVYPDDAPITPEQSAEARAFLRLASMWEQTPGSFSTAATTAIPGKCWLISCRRLHRWKSP